MMKTSVQKTVRRLLCFALLTGLGAAGVHAQNFKADKFGRYRLFNDRVYDVAPNIEVVLRLTDEQRVKIQEALDGRANDPVLQEKIQAYRSAKDGGDKEAESAAFKAMDEAKKAAVVAYEEKLTVILTGDQKAKIDQLNLFVREVQDQTKPEMDEMRAAHPDGSFGWPQECELIGKRGRERLTEVLTPEEVTAASEELTPVTP